MNYLNNKWSILWAFLITLSFNSSLFAQVDIQGNVWLELPLNGSTENTYGVRDANETQGIANVIVTAYPGGTTATTAADGSYTLSVASAGDYRIEFNWDNINGLQASADAAMQNTSIQFVSAPTNNVNLGLHAPADYTQANPDIITTICMNGDPNGGGTAASTASVHYNSYTASGNATPPTSIATFGDVGAVYGEAFQRESSTFFLAAFAKRHSGVKNSLGSIFKIENPTGGSPNISEYFSLDALGFPTGTITARDLAADRNDPSRDIDAFAKIGKVSLGDIELDANEENLYIVNLFDKMLYRVNIGNPAKASITAADITRFPITDPACTGGEWRPFALGLDAVRNVLLIGGVCDASGAANFDDNSNLRGYIYEFDLTTQTMGATAVLDFPLDFTRGRVNNYAPTTHRATHWNPWITQASDWNHRQLNGVEVYFPQPLFADIEVDVDGSLVLGFRDLWGDQVGHHNYAPLTGNTNLFVAQANGDMYRVWNNNGTYIMESNGSFPNGPTGCGVGSGDGPGGGEYYCNDSFIRSNGDLVHNNTALGGLGILAGSGQVLSANMDPITVWSGGIDWTNTNTGAIDQSYQYYISSGSTNNGTFGKANGIGDLEFISAAAPIEIGNLVWNDANENGVQDAGEAGIENVRVELLDSSGGLIDFATTDANGNYIFSNASGTSSASHQYGVALSPNENYSLRIPDVSTQAPIASLITSPSLSGQGTNATSNDSNGVAAGDHVNTTVSAASIPFSGANNHTFDFGFRACTTVRCGTIDHLKNMN